MSDVSLRYLLFGEDRSASKTIHDVGGTAHSMATNLGGVFSNLAGTIGGEMGEVLEKIGTGLEHIGEKGGGAGPKLLAAGAALTGIGAALSLIGSRDKQAADQLKSAIEATGNASEDFAEDIEKTVRKMEDYGHKASDTKDALATLTEATQDPQRAIDSMGLAADLAAAKHESLSEASRQLAQGLAGRGRVFREFGVTLKTNADGTKDVNDAMQELQRRLDGQASASVDNFKGKVDGVKTKIEDWAGSIGQTLGPALTAAGPGISAVGSMLQVIAANGGVAASLTRAWAAAQVLLDAAMDAMPLVAIVAGIAAIALGLYEAWQHSETFRRIVLDVFHDVAAAVSALWEDGIRPVFRFIVDTWLAVAGALVDGAAKAFGWMPGLGGKLKAAAKHFDAFRDHANDMLAGISDKTVHVNADLRISHAANAALHATAPLTIGRAMAAGGLVTGGIPGRDSVPAMLMPGEFVVRADRSNLVVNGGGRDAGGITVTIQAGVLTRDGAREIDKVLRQLARETGGALGYA